MKCIRMTLRSGTMRDMNLMIDAIGMGGVKVPAPMGFVYFHFSTPASAKSPATWAEEQAEMWRQDGVPGITVVEVAS